MKNILSKAKIVLTHPYLMLALRMFLVYTFFRSGWEKIQHLDSFVEIVKAYEILPGFLAEIFGRTLPFVELLVAFWFLLGFLPKITASLTALMLFSFMIATVFNLLRGHELESCGCFDLSEYEEGFGWHTFFRQVGYMALAALVFFGKHSLLSIDALLKKKKKDQDEKTTPDISSQPPTS